MTLKKGGEYVSYQRMPQYMDDSRSCSRGRKQECDDHRMMRDMNKEMHEEEACCKRSKRCMLSPEIVREMKAAVDDELSAVMEYAKLARKFKCDPTMQAWITNIAGDEYGHARAFSMALAAAGCAEEQEKCCKEMDDY